MRKIKIAFIGAKSFPSQAGVDRVVEAIVQKLAVRGGYEITVYGDHGKLYQSKAPPNVYLIPIKPFGIKYLRAFSQFLLAGIHAVTRGDYDLVHLHNLEASYILPLLRLRYPVVATSHIVTHRRMDQWGRVARWLIHLMEWPFMYLSNDRTAVSLTDAQYYMGRHGRTVKWIPNGVEPTDVINREGINVFLKKYGIKANEYILFAAGRIIPTKGAHILLEAVKKMGEISYPVVILGDLSRDPDYGRQLQKMAMAIGNIRFIPFIQLKKEVEAIMAGARLLVFPSFVEGMSMVLLEAATQKTPMIVSDIPENKSVLENNTLYFRSGDAGDLSVKLVWALEHPEKMDKLAVDAYLHVKEKFSWGKVVSDYEQCYQQTLRGRR